MQRPLTHVPVSAPRTASFEAIYRSHASAVARFAVKLGGPREDVDDLVQEVFVVVHDRLPTFRGEADIRTWLYAITRNVVRHRRRGAHRALRRTAELSAIAAPEQATPEDALLRRQKLGGLSAALDQLDEKYRTTILLHAVEGLSGNEIAARTGVEPATVWVRLHRARHLLKSALIRGALILMMLGGGASLAAKLAGSLLSEEPRKESAPPATNIQPMKKLTTAICLSCALAAAPAIAQTPEEPPPEPENKVVYSRKTIVEFSDVKLSAEVTRPANAYILVRTKTQFIPFLKLRTDFDPELLRSIDAL
jgi:RNA polymerase sigma-70 factor, ECF subfamily